MLGVKAGAYLSEAPSGTPLWVGSWPYSQTLDLAQKAYRGQTLLIIMKITDIKSFITMAPGGCNIKHMDS